VKKIAMTNAKKMVQLNNIIKTYNEGAVLAVDKVSFSVSEGELFGLIGPDGAGKTSIFRILATLLFADSGTASVNGWDVVNDYRNIRNNIGYMPGKFSLYQDLSVEENLEFFATLFGTTIKENYYLVKDIYIQLEPFKDRRAGKLSGGMKQKLALCCALIHKPLVLFLDEPTTGVDPVSRKEFWNMLKRLKEQGITIVVSTPYMDEANLCDRIALMQNAKIMSVETPENIKSNYKKELWAVASPSMHNLLTDLRNFELTESCYAFGDSVHLSFKEQRENSRENTLSYLESRNHSGLEMHRINPGIEDCFISLMQQ